MHEDEKIGEAEYFLDQMEANKKDRRAFICNLSAFLGAGRSVLQYAHLEACGKKDCKGQVIVAGKPGGPAWWDPIAKEPLIKFFKEERNKNVHQVVEPPRAQRDERINQDLCLKHNVAVGRTNAAGNETAVFEGATEAEASMPPRAQPESEVKWLFKDGQYKDQDVMLLCQSYLARLKQVIAAGRAKNILTFPSGPGAGAAPT